MIEMYDARRDTLYQTRNQTEGWQHRVTLTIFAYLRRLPAENAARPINRHCGVTGDPADDRFQSYVVVFDTAANGRVSEHYLQYELYPYPA